MKVSNLKKVMVWWSSIASSSSSNPQQQPLDPDLMSASPLPNSVAQFNVDSPVTPPSSSATRKYSAVPARSPDRIELLWHLVQSPHQKLIPLTAEQLGYCREALTLLTKKLNASGGRRRTIDKEFDSLSSDRVQAKKFYARTTIGRLYANQPKNRYMDVLPYDDTRVILEAPAVNGSEAVSSYINASYVMDPVHESLPKFIATQGPLQNTAVDFWEMVVQQQCPVVVMLTGFVDPQNKALVCD